MSSRRANLLLSVIVLLSLVIQPLNGVAAVPTLAAPSSVASPTAHFGPGFLFRVTVALDSVRNLARLEKTGVLVLRALDGEQVALVLADGDQLADLARLGFKPRGADELRLLLDAQGPEKRWLAESLTPVLAQADAIVAQKAAAGVAGAAAAPDVAPMVASLRAAVSALTPEQIAGAASSISVDDDADGLTNTEEAWWCTNPLNPNSDGDASGYTDGQEVAALLNFTLSRTVRWNYGPPFGPPAAWPNFNNRDGTGLNVCNDGDYDTIPDYAEAYMVGTRVGTGDSENTDGDKFDDGQELFGTTFCPGGTASCAWGNYPRTQDYSFITSGMPSWIRPPGDSPFVAAYPVIDFLVDPATVKVTTKEIRTIERTITQGEEISTGFAETTGNSTTVGTVDTNTHNAWQEHSTAEGGIAPGSAEASLDVVWTTNRLRYPYATGRQVEPPESKSAPKPAGAIPHTSAFPPQITILPGPAAAEDEIVQAVRQALLMAPSALAMSDQFTISALDFRGSEWLLATVVALKDIRDKYSWNVLDNGAWFGLVILTRDASGLWSGAVEGTEQFTLELMEAPEAVISAQAKLNLDSLNQQAQSDGGWEFGYAFPWKPGTKMVYSQDLHPNGRFGWNAIDLASAGGHGYAPNYARAARGGNIKVLCHDHLGQAWIQINNLSYLHLVYDERIHRDGEPRMTGDYLGTLMVGPIENSPDHCGYSTQNASTYHLHLGIESVPITFEGWELRSDGLFYQGNSTIGEGQDVLASGQLADDPCNAPSVKSTDAVPNTLPASQKRTSFFEIVGRTLKTWLGKLTGGAERFRSATETAAVPGCSGSSCASQVGVNGSYASNFSDNRSAGQCKGGLQPSGFTDWGTGGGGSGLALNDNGGELESLRVWSETTTTGEGWSTSHSELRSETQYSELTRSRTNTLVSSEAWSTATTTDPTDAARLTFNYNLYNTGSDAAVHLTGLKINILIGDLPVITWNAPDNYDIVPGQAKGPVGSDQINLALEQLAAIDNGAPIRVVLADYGYDDNLYDANAWGRSVLFHVDDGSADGDESIDTYLVTTNLVQGETYQDTLARYFDVTTFQGAPGDERNGTITGISTPEFAGDGEITGWQDHPVNDHAWWELSISLGGETDGVQHFRDMPAKPKTDVYLRYVLDTDGDGFSDRAELDAGSDPNDPDIHPRPLVTLAQHTTVSGGSASVQVTLQNDGNLDASSVELWAIAADDSITITDNLVGGGGRVRAGRQVVLGSRIGKPDLTAWTTSTAKPYPDGQFEGASPTTFKFQALDSGNVGAGTLRVKWSNDNGATWQPTPLALGSGYTAWTPLSLSDGLTLAFSAGYIAMNETFTFETALPIDTFAYTINRTPYTPPLIIASYNDPEGNHKFVSDVELPDIQADLAPYLGDMRYGFQLDVMAPAPFAAGTNTAHLVFNNPAAQAISGANLYVEFATPDGTVAKEYVLANQALLSGPNVATLAWDTADFNPAFDPAADYHILVFAADRQGTILENTVKDLDQVGKDRLPAAVLPGEDWNFGVAQQGTLMRHTLTVANTGYRDMLTFVAASDPAIKLSDEGSRTVAPGDVTLYEIGLNTADLAVGSVDQTITIRTSDPNNPTRTVHVVGTVTAAPADTPVGALQRPLDWPATVSGNQGDWVEFTHTLSPDPQTLHPVKVYSQDYGTLWGVGRYATAFSAGTASYEMFGDGRDGARTIAANTTDSPIDSACSGSAGAYTLSATNAGFAAGQVVMIHQTQGASAGTWMLNKIASYSAGTITLQKPLNATYSTGAQVLVVRQYTDVTVNSGASWTAKAWNGTTGGIMAFLANGTVTVSGAVVADAVGYRRGGARGDTRGGGGGEGINGWSGQGGDINQAPTQPGGGGAAGGDTPTNSGAPSGAGSGGAGGGYAKGTDANEDEGAGAGGGGGHAYGGGGGGGGQDAHLLGGAGGLSNVATGGGGGGGYANAGGASGQPGGGSGGAGGGTGFTGAGGNGAASSEQGSAGGGGGGNYGTADLTRIYFGSGGGAGGGVDKRDNSGWDGGSGGGIVVILGKKVTLLSSGAIRTDGAAGSSSTNHGGSGGGGAGGSVLLRAGQATLGTLGIAARGGSGGSPSNPGGGGGQGSPGRIRVEYCDTPPAFSTSPAASTQKLNCYLAEQVESSPYTTTRLNLPESGTHTYQVQYGRKLSYAGAAALLPTLRVPAGMFSSVTVQALVSDLTSSAFLNIDVGNTGTSSWSGTVSNNSENTSPNLAPYFNAYWASHGAPTSGTLDVPVSVYLDRAGQVLLTNLKVTPTGSKLRSIRLPVRPQGYSSVMASFTVSGGSGPLAVGVDVGANGSVDWTYTGSPAYPASLTTGDLATAVAAYLAGQSGEVDVPIRFYLAPFATLALTGFTAVPAGATDAGLSNTDLTFDTATPSEGDVVTVTAIVHNAESLDTGPLTVSFYATPASGIETRIGSGFVANVPAAGTATASLQWNTLGFTGDVPVRAVVDPYNRLTEADETNNGATATLPIKTRPDLRVTDIAVTDTGPVVGQAVTVTLTLHNAGQTAAAASVLALYDDHPDQSRVLICEDGGSTPANATRTVTCQWIPTVPGQHRLFAEVDRDQAVNEFNETNNAA